ncbi:hypothetical protein LJB86_03055 [Deltaproteobacteria bacterium OttesenSCG-928-M10]|nr:hypothetical protein [Deltaproteobacteria bacterium OttesenSCG-928-M10]
MTEENLMLDRCDLPLAAGKSPSRPILAAHRLPPGGVARAARALLMIKFCGFGGEGIAEQKM